MHDDNLSIWVSVDFAKTTIDTRNHAVSSPPRRLQAGLALAAFISYALQQWVTVARLPGSVLTAGIYALFPLLAFVGMGLLVRLRFRSNALAIAMLAACFVFGWTTRLTDFGGKFGHWSGGGNVGRLLSVAVTVSIVALLPLPEIRLPNAPSWNRRAFGGAFALGLVGVVAAFHSIYTG